MTPREQLRVAVFFYTQPPQPPAMSRRQRRGAVSNQARYETRVKAALEHRQRALAQLAALSDEECTALCAAVLLDPDQQTVDVLGVLAAASEEVSR